MTNYFEHDSDGRRFDLVTVILIRTGALRRGKTVLTSDPAYIVRFLDGSETVVDAADQGLTWLPGWGDEIEAELRAAFNLSGPRRRESDKFSRVADDLYNAITMNST